MSLGDGGGYQCLTYTVCRVRVSLVSTRHEIGVALTLCGLSLFCQIYVAL